MTAKLSDNQRMLMNGFNAEKNPFSFWDGGFKAEDSGTWESTFVPEVAHIIGKPESTAKRTIHDLVKKGIFASREEPAEDGIPILENGEPTGEFVPDSGRDADHWIELTDAGVELIADLRLEDDEIMLEMDDPDEDDDEDDAPPMQTKSIAALEADKRIKEARAKSNKELKAAAKEDIKQGKPGLRTSHADCDHATQGKEGKMARAKCRRERAAKAAAEQAKANA